MATTYYGRNGRYSAGSDSDWRTYYNYWADDPYYVGGWDSESDSRGQPNVTDFSTYGECKDTSAMTPAELEDYLVAVEAAEIGREIDARPDRDMVEYSSIIYRNSSGVITHTPIYTDGSPTNVQLVPTSDMASWGNVLGYVHSHPKIGVNPQAPDLRVIPTPGANGDWIVFDNVQNLIKDDLMVNRQFTEQAAYNQSEELVQFVFGYTGHSTIGDKYEMFRYDSSDQLGAPYLGTDLVRFAEVIDPSLGTCPIV